MKKVDKTILGGRFDNPDIKDVGSLSKLFGYFSRLGSIEISDKNYENLDTKNGEITIQKAHDEFDRKYIKFISNVRVV